MPCQVVLNGELAIELEVAETTVYVSLGSGVRSGARPPEGSRPKCNEWCSSPTVVSLFTTRSALRLTATEPATKRLPHVAGR